MRTTLTLDDDVAAKLQAEARRSNRSFKAVVNDMLRRGLLRAPKAPTSQPFIVRSQALGLPAGLDYSNTEELLEAIEGPLRP